IDFREKDDEACVERLRSLMGKYRRNAVTADDDRCPSPGRAARSPDDIYRVFTDKPGAQYDVRDVIACFVDARGATPAAERRATQEATQDADFDEYKAEYRRSIVCGYARIGGHPCGI